MKSHLKKLQFSTNSPQTPRNFRRATHSLKSSSGQSRLHSTSPRVGSGEGSILRETTQDLTKKHYFLRYRADGTYTLCKVYFTETLLQLIIEKDSNSSIVLPTSELVNIELGFSRDTLSALLRGEFNTRIFGFRLLSTYKTVELSCNSRIEREKWVLGVKKLLETHSDWNSNRGFKLYWDAVAANARSKIYIDSLLSQNRIETEQRVQFENSQITQKFLQEIKKKEAEIELLREEINVAEGQLEIMYKSIEYSSLEELPKIWLKILEYFSIKELLILKCVSRFYKELVQKFLSLKNNWKRLPLGGLYPRKVSWKLYFDKFYTMKLKDLTGQVPSQMLLEIHRDVYRGLPDFQNEVLWIVANLCFHHPEIGYCQGMQQVAHFMLKRLGHTDKTLRILLVLIRPPYFLGDMWKSGMPRLKIAVFQLEFLVEVKLPILSKHLKALDVKLDVIVSAWLLTIFVNLNAQQGFPIGEIEHIWDFFLVQGWPALLSACLALLDASQQYVIGESLENTLEVYASQLLCQDLSKLIARFEVDPALLDDLERAYYLQ